MKAKYSEEVDILCLNFKEGTVDDSDEIVPGVIADYDDQGNLLALEIMDISQKLDPTSVAQLARVATAFLEARRFEVKESA